MSRAVKWSRVSAYVLRTGIIQKNFAIVELEGTSVAI